MILRRACYNPAIESEQEAQMGKLEKTSKKVGTSAARQLKNAKNPKEVKSAEMSTLTPMPGKEKATSKKKNKK